MLCDIVYDFLYYSPLCDAKVQIALLSHAMEIVISHDETHFQFSTLI